MEKKFKRVTFDLELAKDIQQGKVEGRIVTNNGGEARILAFDSKSCFVESKTECYTTKDKGINKPLVVEYLDVNGDSQIYQVVNLLTNGKLVTWGDSDCDLFIELPEAPKHDLKVGDKPRLVCPKCLKSFDNCKSWPAYHNRLDYECPHCGYTDDSIEFETCYSWHPYNKTED